MDEKHLSFLWSTTVTLVIRPGLEPEMTEPKTVVLPLHYRTIISSILLPAARNCILLSPTLAVWVLEFERIIGLEPTLFHIGSVMPYQLGEIRNCVGGTNLRQMCTSSISSF